MNPLDTFVCGFSVMGVMASALYWMGFRRTLSALSTQTQQLQHEKQIVLSFMHQVAESLSSTTEPTELMERIVQAATESTGALAAAFFKSQPDGSLVRIAVEGLFPPQHPRTGRLEQKAKSRVHLIYQALQPETFQPGEGIIGQVAQTRKGLLIPHAHNHPQIHPRQDPALILHSLIVVPLCFRSELIGVLAIANPASRTSFGQTDFSLAQSLAEQAGLALYNQGLLQVQREKHQLDADLLLARNIQAMLLPHRWPQFKGFEVSALYVPAQQVGGDLYDIFTLGPHQLGVVVADVSGKGMAASLLMAICQTHLRHCVRQSVSPATALRALNQELQYEIRRGLFITLTYVLIDTQAHTLTLARSGHEPPLLLRPPLAQPKNTDSHHRIYSYLQPEGIALGMVPTALYEAVLEETTLPFPPGSTLLLYTDGLTEMHNPQVEEFGSMRLAQHALELEPAATADEFNQRLFNRLKQFAEGMQAPDDLTLVTIRHNG